MTSALEIVLHSDPIIKYVHDVTRFTELSMANDAGWKIFVFALHSHVSNHEELAEKLKDKLAAINLISSSATIVDSRYTEIFLPTLHDSDLQLIKEEFGDLTHVIKTENFSAGVENIAKKW